MLVELCLLNFILDYVWLIFFVFIFVLVGIILVEGMGVVGVFIFVSYIFCFEGSFYDGCSYFGMFCGFLGLL